MDTKQKILNLYNNKYDHKKDRKIVNLLKFVLVDNEEDLFKLERLTPITQKTMMNYSYDEEYMLKFLTKEEYKIFIKKIEFILELAEKKEDIKDLYLIGQIIDELFNTRHKIEEVCSNNFFPILKFRKILADENFIDNNFGAGLKSKIKNRIAETTLIRTSVPKNQILIQDRFHLFVVKENIHYLNPVDYKKLKLASDYLCSGADLDFVVKKYNVYATSVIPILSDSKLKEILKEKAKKLKQHCEENNIEIDIEMDGGIYINNCKDVKEAGVNMIVAGSGI